MKYSISLTCYKRLDYLKIVMDSIKKSAEYCNIYPDIYVSIDYYNNDIPEYIEKISWTNVIYSINRPNLGCNANTLQAMTQVCSKSNDEAFLHLEDDTPITKDALSYYANLLDRYQDDENILSITGYNKTPYLNPQEIDKTIDHVFFTAWGCAFWKKKMSPIFNNWIPIFTNQNIGMSWDSHINEFIYQKNGYKEIRPVISRIQNIGSENGSWVPSANWHYDNQRTPYTMDDLL